MGIHSVETLYASPFRGPLFESLIISDLYKQYFNYGLQPHLYFWRTQNGSIEIDCLIEQNMQLIPIEIKSGQTIVEDFFGPIKQFNEIIGSQVHDSYIIYAGDMVQKRSNRLSVLGYKEGTTLITDLKSK